jgi:S1-C subfamily serine protease
VPESELDANLEADERTVVGVVRRTERSVAYITSIWPLDATSSSNENGNPFQRRQRRQQPRRRQKRRNDDDNNNNNNDSSSSETTPLPRGQNLGSGSGFLVHEDGYLVTNFHVIQQAYRIQQMAHMVDQIRDSIVGNISQFFSPASSSIVNATVQRLFPPDFLPSSSTPSPQVYACIDSSSTTEFRPCRIVQVQPQLDIAVLKIITQKDNKNDDDDDSKRDGKNNSGTGNNTTTTTKFIPLQFGSSSELLVGQDLIAIGNPFGLQNSVSVGVVSALNRELQVTSSRNNGLPFFFDYTDPYARSMVIRDCIQTDCAINPGNSGGPLLSRRGTVVGVNTAILSTSGSNAGIGFAVPSDSVKDMIQTWIRNDIRISNSISKTRRTRPWLGIHILARNKRNDGAGELPPLVVSRIEPDAPATRAGVRALHIANGTVEYGDAIVAFNGKLVESYEDLQTEFDRCVVGEQINLTLQDLTTGTRRVVYLTLTEAQPSS